jgi:hypothetical protein
VQRLYWDQARKLYADHASKQKYSQHTNTLVVLADVATGAAAHDLMLRIQTEPGLAKAALYFKFYLHQALVKVGEGDRYLDLLGDWHEMLGKGLTTFAERMDLPGNPSRSDCHAWSASPNIELLRTVLGVDSAAPAFARVAVRPHLGKLPFANGSVPHPKGSLDVRLAADGNVTVTLPAGVTGVFEWRGAKHELAPGTNRLQV